MKNKLLNYEIYFQKNSICSVVLLHGLFGDLRNLGILKRSLQNRFNIIQIDIRNHGKSFHENTMSYSEMGQDIMILLEYLKQKKIILIGQSMGGKIAMAMTEIDSNKIIDKLIIIDIAPVSYPTNRHQNIFFALNTVQKSNVFSRKEAESILKKIIREEKEIQYLLKSFQKGNWKFNLPIIEKEYKKLIGWDLISPKFHEILFIFGEHSEYFIKSHHNKLINQFPKAIKKIVKNCGHWVIYENSSKVLQHIHNFLKK